MQGVKRGPTAPPHFQSLSDLFSHLLQGGMGAALLADPDKIEAVSTDTLLKLLSNDIRQKHLQCV